MTVGKREQLEVLLEAESSKMDEVVVTGVYTRKKESFTGSSQTYKAEELKSVGNQNLIQSLKVLDPAFAVLESNEFGSDPNRLPDLEIRGKSSIVGLKEQFGEDPNQPLFILDGFETTLRTIMDLSMDRIASVTILKDAASTASGAAARRRNQPAASGRNSATSTPDNALRVRPISVSAAALADVMRPSSSSRNTASASASKRSKLVPTASVRLSFSVNCKNSSQSRQAEH